MQSALRIALSWKDSPMRALVIPVYGGPEVLTLSELPVPEPGPGQILVRTAAAAVNPVDLLTRSGALAEHIGHPLPLVPGWDVSGTVEALGSGVTRFAAGDRVIAMIGQLATGIGTCAEYVVLDASAAALAPGNTDLVDAAALPLAGLTAHQALEQLAPEPGSTLLVSGAVGAVGGFAVQLASALGLRVIAHVRPGDERLARELGAAEVLPADAPVPAGVADALLATTGDPGRVLGAVRDGGRAVTVYVPDPPAAERGITVSTCFAREDGERLAEVSGLVEKGVLTLRIAGVLPLAEGAAAHARLEAGGVRGKLLLSV
ncbi:NADP-dependent oxidoreductase [Kitasatospora sp. NPDC057541]|uniref:NADP-dependent oxidoreductase n=1 Tax=unclassified Kitasatospora TaxID=2633591 RepID=UPI003687011A